MAGGGSYWDGEANNSTIERLAEAIEALNVTLTGQPPEPMGDVTIAVQEYQRPDGSTKRVVETRSNGTTITTTFGVPIVEAD